jgi:hypothetical protein
MHKYFALALSALFCLVPVRALATDYSDIWWSPPENGWGMNIAQSDNFIFATFFVYDANGLPTWYTGQLTNDGNGHYTGQLYATTGSYFGAVPYDNSLVHIGQVGVATFSPLTATTAVLTYNVGPVNVAKNVQRLTLTAIALGGNYSGGQTGAYSGASCGLGGYTDHYDLQVTQPGDGTVTLQFSYLDSNMNCTMSGTLQQVGLLYSVPNATYSCSTGLNTNASMSEIKATSLGIEGRFAAPSVGGGCREDANFSAVLQ